MRLQVSSTPQLVSADQTSSVKVLPAGATLYYKATSDVSSSSNDGNITSGSSLVFTAPKWVATASGSTATVDTVDVDGMGFEYSQPGAPLSNEAISYLSTLSGVGTGALTGTSLTVTGAISGAGATFSGLVKANAGVDVQAALSGPVYLSRQVAANRVIGNNLLSADANNAFNILGDGKINWGAGGASAVDTNLYRNAANVLKTDDALVVTGALVPLAGVDNQAAIAGSVWHSQQIAANKVLSNNLLGADANNAFHILGDGKMEWGAGGASAVDINLYRWSSTFLRTDDRFQALQLSVETAASAGSGVAFQTYATGDSATRFNILDNTKFEWGDGSAAKDTNLYRSSANVLKTDDSFVAASCGGRPSATTDGVSGLISWAEGIDTWQRFQVTGSGKILLGDGTAAPSCNLYQSAANVLATDDALVVTGLVTTNVGVDIGAAAAGPVWKSQQVAGNMVLGNKLLSADANYSFRIQGNGVLYWGAGGATAVDCDLFRTAANQLMTNDQFNALDGITTKVVAGTVSDGSFTATPASGTIAIDTTNSLIYVRVGSTWKSVAVA